MYFKKTINGAMKQYLKINKCELIFIYKRFITNNTKKNVAYLITVVFILKRHKI